MKFDSTKSMIRYFPPKGNRGLCAIFRQGKEAFSAPASHDHPQHFHYSLPALNHTAPWKESQFAVSPKDATTQ
jgi:hypothetical protein